MLLIYNVVFGGLLLTARSTTVVGAVLLGCNTAHCGDNINPRAHERMCACACAYLRVLAQPRSVHVRSTPLPRVRDPHGQRVPRVRSLLT